MSRVHSGASRPKKPSAADHRPSLPPSDISESSQRSSPSANLEIHVHGPAADHAEVLHVVFRERKVMLAAALFLEHLFGQLLGLILHRAAAYGAADAPVFADQHPRTRAPRRRARGRYHRDEHQFLAVFEPSGYLPEHVPHIGTTSFPQKSFIIFAAASAD